MIIVLSLNLPTFRLKTQFLLIFSSNLPINNLVPDTEDEEDNSLIEGPKPTEEEAEKIAEDVEQALEENFKELEKKANGDKNGTTNGHANGDKNGTTNGDETKMETDENDGAKMSCIDNNGVNGKAKSKKKFNIPTSCSPHATRNRLSYTLNL